MNIKLYRCAREWDSFYDCPTDIIHYQIGIISFWFFLGVEWRLYRPLPRKDGRE